MTKKIVNIRIPLPADTGLRSEVMWANGRSCALSLPTPVVFETVFEALVKLEVSGVLCFETTELVDH